jgi:hypothetical protein
LGPGSVPSGACGGCRSRVARGLLWSSSYHRLALLEHDLLVWVGLRQLYIVAFADLLGGPGGLIIVAAAGLSLPARALGAKRDHVTNTAVLSGLGICAFVFFLFASLGNLFVGMPLALMAIVATPLIGSLFVIPEDYRFTVRLVRAPVIAGVAIYCASLLAIWLVRGGEGWLYALVPVIVASASWLVMPAIVAALRPG